MNSDATFLYYIKNGSGAYYSVTHEGYVIAGTEAIPLQNSPDGWKGEQLSYIRNETFWGIFTQYKIDLQFIKDGAKILRYIFYREGFEGHGTLEIRKLNTQTRQYNLWTNCDIDFTQFNDTKDYVTVFLKDKGGLEYLQSVQNTPYEIPLNSNTPNVLITKISGLKIKDKVEFAPYTYIQTAGFGSIAYTDLSAINRESELGKDLIPDTVKSIANVSPTADNYGGKYFYMATTTDPVTVTVDHTHIQMSASDSSIVTGDYAASWEIWKIKPDGSIKRVSNGNNGDTYSWPPIAGTNWLQDDFVWDIPNWTFTFNDLEPGDILVSVIYSDAFTQNLTVQLEDVNEQNPATFTVEGSIKFPETTNFALRYFDFAKALINSATNGQYTLQSSFLSSIDDSVQRRVELFDNIPYNTVVTSGDGLRNVPNAVIKTTVADMFKDVWGRWCCGISIQGNIIKIEPLSTLLSNTEALKIGKVNNFRFSPYTDKVINQIHIGYNDYTYDQISGKDEFNTGQTWLIQNVKRISKEDDLITPYRADMFGIEYLRNQKTIQATGNSQMNTVDDASDNDVFLIEISPYVTPDPITGIGYYVPFIDYQIISGLENTDYVYNVSLSPKRNLYRHLRRILSFCKTGQVTFQTSDKNSELVSYITGFVHENANFDLSNLSFLNSPLYSPNLTPLYQSLAFEFDCAAPYNFAEIMANALNGYISFEWNGIIMKGYILDVGVTPATRDTYTFKVLSHKDNDLTKLIH